MSVNLSIQGKLFRSRNPGTTVKRRVKSLRFPVVTHLRETVRAGRPPSSRPSFFATVSVSVVERLTQRCSLRGAYGFQLVASDVGSAGWSFGSGDLEMVANAVVIEGASLQVNFSEGTSQALLFSVEQAGQVVLGAAGVYAQAIFVYAATETASMTVNSAPSEHTPLVGVTEHGEQEIAAAGSPYNPVITAVDPGSQVVGLSLGNYVLDEYIPPPGDDVELKFDEDPYSPDPGDAVEIQF